MQSYQIPNLNFSEERAVQDIFKLEVSVRESIFRVKAPKSSVGNEVDGIDLSGIGVWKHLDINQLRLVGASNYYIWK